MSTPQDVALTDVRRGIAMFRKINVPVRPLYFSTITSLTTTSIDLRSSSQSIPLHLS